jgi:exodeoxyribonuclease VII large subunit
MPNFQSLLFTNEPLSVSGVTNHIKALLETDEELADLRVLGEVGNITRPASGHVYFTLKDATAQIKCVMWKSAAARLRQLPRTGDSVIARGHVSVYERDGAYQLYVDSLVPAGTGDLFAEFERLKRALEAEGLFDAERKRPLPAFPRVLGVVTSATGAAFQDILNVLGRRCPMIEVILAHTLVQGDGAPEQIARAIRLLDECGECDVILVARGGGSMEELWAFNDERVVRAVVASSVPVVSGVGHEVDFTLCDFAADMRAPTPSAAAELIAPDLAEWRLGLDDLAARLTESMQDRIEEERERLEALVRALRMANPLDEVRRMRERVTELQSRMLVAAASAVSLQRARVAGLSGRLEAVSPLATLARGYAIVQRQSDGALVRSVDDAQPGSLLDIRISDGAFTAKVEPPPAPSPL